MRAKHREIRLQRPQLNSKCVMGALSRSHKVKILAFIVIKCRDKN